MTDAVVVALAASAAAEGLRQRGGPLGRSSDWCDVAARRSATLRSTEADDIHVEACITPGSVVVPVALTLAAELGVEAAPRIAPAMLAGYEMMVRLGRAIGGARALERGAWPSLFAAPFAAAATASRLLELDVDKTSHALSIALLAAAARVGVTSGARPARWLLYGLAVRAGCTAALAAEAGFQGDPRLLDSQWPEAQFPQTWAPGALTEATPPGDLDGLRLKPFCTAMQLLSALHGVRMLLAPRDAVQEIELAVPPATAAMVNHGVERGERLSSITSAPYQIACAALAPERLYDIDRSDVEPDETLRAFMKKIRTVADANLLEYWPREWPARVTVFSGTEKRSKLVRDVPFDEAAVQRKWERLRPADCAVWTKATARFLDDPRIAWSVCEKFRTINP